MCDWIAKYSIDRINLVSYNIKYTFCGMAWLEKPMKVVASCDMLWGGARNLRSRDHLMRLLIWSLATGNLLNWNILVSRGKESNSDSVSNGERTQNRTNRILVGNYKDMWSDLCNSCNGWLKWYGMIYLRRWKSCKSICIRILQGSRVMRLEIGVWI